MPQPLVVTLKTLTPLWLGGVDPGGAEVKESGILGSLRDCWERILRRSGISVCNPTSENAGDRCPKDDRFCPACQVFGATGWARRFRMEFGADKLSKVPLFFRASRDLVNRERQWLRGAYRGKEALFGEFDLSLAFRPQDELDAAGLPAVLRIVLQSVASTAGLGAKTQHGFGQVRVVTFSGKPASDQDTDACGRWLVRAKVNSPLQAQKPLKRGPAHRLWKFTTPPYAYTDNSNANEEILTQPVGFKQEYIPCSFAIRRILRDRFAAAHVNPNGLFGWIERHSPKGEGSRMQVSHLYRTEDQGPYYLKIWGDLENLQHGLSAARVWETVEPAIEGLKGILVQPQASHAQL